ncbi:MAG: transglycosylase SLT domain-containing protein [Proteobacteria bacterium]|nr:transglycosylase SLT domain-containing protein [Pseudomonadota bacterium]
MRRLFKSIWYCIAAAALPGFAPALANQTQPIDNTWNLCAEQTLATERRTAIPRHLLGAISLAESGRWNKSKQENVAWPWTVTSGGQGRYFDTKAEALAEVEILLTKGVRNIDVGCMQINLFYHSGAFETLDEAFDPGANTTYAATYLKNMFSATGDWTEAAGYYHSMTPERNGPYKKKVLNFWRRQGGDPTPDTDLAERTPEDKPFAGIYAPLDHARMAQLNARFKDRKETDKAAPGVRSKTEDLKATAERQLNEWREARSRGLGMAHLVAMRRAEMEINRKRKMDRLGSGDKKETFAAKRARQLKDWRLKISGQGVNTARLAFQAPPRKLSVTDMAANAAGASVR